MRREKNPIILEEYDESTLISTMLLMPVLVMLIVLSQEKERKKCPSYERKLKDILVNICIHCWLHCFLVSQKAQISFHGISLNEPEIQTLNGRWQRQQCQIRIITTEKMQKKVKKATITTTNQTPNVYYAEGTMVCMLTIWHIIVRIFVAIGTTNLYEGGSNG